MFNMTYLINTDSWKPGGPILFYTGNEGSIEHFAQNSVSYCFTTFFEGFFVWIGGKYVWSCIICRTSILWLFITVRQSVFPRESVFLAYICNVMFFRKFDIFAAFDCSVFHLLLCIL